MAAQAAELVVAGAAAEAVVPGGAVLGVVGAGAGPGDPHADHRCGGIGTDGVEGAEEIGVAHLGAQLQAHLGRGQHQAGAGGAGDVAPAESIGRALPLQLDGIGTTRGNAVEILNVVRRADRVPQFWRIAGVDRHRSGGGVIDVGHRGGFGTAHRFGGAEIIGVAGFDMQLQANMGLLKLQAVALAQQGAAGIPGIADRAGDPIRIQQRITGLQGRVLRQRATTDHLQGHLAGGELVGMVDYQQQLGGGDAVALAVIDPVAEFQGAAIGRVVVGGAGIQRPGAIAVVDEPGAMVAGQPADLERIAIGILEAAGQLCRAEAVDIPCHQGWQGGIRHPGRSLVDRLAQGADRHRIGEGIPVGEKIQPLRFDAAATAAAEQCLRILDVVGAIEDLLERLRIGLLVAQGEAAGIEAEDRRQVGGLGEIEAAAAAGFVQQRQGELDALLIIGKGAENRHIHFQLGQGQRRGGVPLAAFQNREGVEGQQVARCRRHLEG